MDVGHTVGDGVGSCQHGSHQHVHGLSDDGSSSQIAHGLYITIGSPLCVHVCCVQHQVIWCASSASSSSMTTENNRGEPGHEPARGRGSAPA
jgi:hypothetical protein